MKRFLVFLTGLLFLAGNSVWAQRANYNIIPLPKNIKTDTTQVFSLQEGMGIAYDASNNELARNAKFLAQWVEEATGIKLALSPNNKKAAIQLIQGASTSLKNKKGEKTGKTTEQQQEAYSITVNKAGVIIRACQPVGIFRAIQTLRKSLPVTKTTVAKLPYTVISDQPRFAYRGAMLDCARHFFTVEVVKQYIDMLALHGCNQFHWHLTEDQGWRFEVKALPELTQKGSIRKQTVIGPNTGIYDETPYGGYYTQEDCKEIVRYAAERYINVIPEIDLPGHMQAALHVFPNLGCTGGPYPVRTEWGISRDVLCGGTPETLAFLKTVIGELCDVFPSKYIHIGGDECPKDRWRKCQKCQAKIKELGLKNDGKHSLEDQLQTYINHEMEQFLNERGRELIGWDEILAGGLTEGSIVMSWRGTQGGIEAVKQHHNVIMSPNIFAYLDHPQFKDLTRQPQTIGGYVVSCSKIYSFEPTQGLSDEEKKYIIGVQGNLWTEYIAHPEFAFYQLLPRLAAISEIQWCNSDQKDFDAFKKRLPQIKKLYDRIGIPYCHEIE